MKPRTVQYCLRLPREAYENAHDVSLVFDMSLNQFFLGAIRAYVESQLSQEVIRNAVAKTREARSAGLVDAPDEIGSA
jgi:hypothetical protein